MQMEREVMVSLNEIFKVQNHLRPGIAKVSIELYTKFISTSCLCGHQLLKKDDDVHR